jgi:hypothetical protein
MIKYNDITGLRFGRLVVKCIDHKKSGNIFWECVCDCGNTKITSYSSLNSGHTNSCGCIRKETAKNQGKCNLGLRRSKLGSLVGKIYNNWTVLELVDSVNDDPYKSLWLCRCTCGNERTVKAHNLIFNRVKSCGCLKKGVPISDLTGQRFGNVTVTRFDHREKSQTYWECLCDCGNTVVFTPHALRHNKSVSCGCLNSHLREEKNRKSSINTLYRGYKSSAVSRNLPFSLSLEDFKSIIIKECSYCCRQPIREVTSKLRNYEYSLLTYNGIDRVDNTKGYTLENCVPCCRSCNFAKCDGTREQFIDWVERVYQHSEDNIECAIQKI